MKPEHRKQLVAGVVIVGAGLALAGMVRSRGTSSSSSWRRQRIRGGGATKPAAKGFVVCPAELAHVPVSLAGAKPGDFVTLRLVAADGSFSEFVWAVIVSIHGAGSKLPGSSTSPDSALVQLTGTIGTTSVSAPKSQVHGYTLGERILVSNDCAWDLLRARAGGMALCGLFGKQVAGAGVPAAAGAVVAGEEVLLYVAPISEGGTLVPAPGWDVPNPVWARVTSVSASKHVLTVMLLEDPEPRGGLLLAAGSELDISRDCIFDVRPGGSG